MNFFFPYYFLLPVSKRNPLSFRFLFVTSVPVPFEVVDSECGFDDDDGK